MATYSHKGDVDKRTRQILFLQLMDDFLKLRILQVCCEQDDPAARQEMQLVEGAADVRLALLEGMRKGKGVKGL